MHNETKDVKDVMPKKGRPKGAVDTVPRKKRTDVNKSLTVEPGDISKITAFNFQWYSLSKVDTGNREQVEGRIVDYFKACIESDMRPGVAGLCAALGIGRTTWYDWWQGNKRDYKDLAERIRTAMESITEQYMLQGKINPVTGIFLLKNHFGYVDKNEVVLTPNTNPLGDDVDAEALKQKYLENTYGITSESDTDRDSTTALETKYLTGGKNNE